MATTTTSNKGRKPKNTPETENIKNEEIKDETKPTATESTTVESATEQVEDRNVHSNPENGNIANQGENVDNKDENLEEQHTNSNPENDDKAGENGKSEDTGLENNDPDKKDEEKNESENPEGTPEVTPEGTTPEVTPEGTPEETLIGEEEKTVFETLIFNATYFGTLGHLIMGKTFDTVESLKELAVIIRRHGAADLHTMELLKYIDNLETEKN